jgi:two-component system sensor histidine kinase QseC
MAAVARAMVVEFKRQATARGQRLVLDAAAAVPSPLPAALAQVLMRNLIDNAVRYSPDGALVRISVCGSPEGGAGRLVVEDSGPGLTPDAMARLGERFFRVVGSQQTGSGLGWSIVRRLARLFELDLVVDRSAALGGLRVTVSWKQDGRVHQA